ncbi:recombinase A [Klebsiella pneumoniae]|uniref:Protein RecA n=1 Tax=Klebsiella pneumoniae TaxID=573 RepID=A0A378FN66_KLEPN|nr:recombinase A [Klebsiella pneumoniae]
MAIDENKQKALAAALGQIEKQFGKGSIMRLGEDRTMDVETISTGSLSLDIALGAGGLPMGPYRRDLRSRNPPVKPP